MEKTKSKSSIKKREQKHSEKTAPEKEEKTEKDAKKEEEVKIDSKYRMALNFNLYIGDDTGLIKRVKMLYNYQTDIIGSTMAYADESFAKETDEAAENDEAIALKKQKQEKYSTTVKYDKDGQPLFKMMRKHIGAKQTAKYGKQVKYEGIALNH